MQYTAHEYADMHLILGLCHNNAGAAVREYAQTYPQRRHPDAKIFRRVDERLREVPILQRGNVNAGRPRRVRNPEIEEHILTEIQNHPEKSTRSIARQFGMSNKTVHTVLKEDGLYPFHLTKVHGLLDGDLEPRLTYSEWILQKHRNDPTFVSKILWTDEANFNRNGLTNIHNMHQWSHENPHVSVEVSHQHRFSVNVWAGILGTRLIGPFILPNRLTANAFLNFLNNAFQDLLEDIPLATRRDMWLQMDGAPPHYGAQVREWLNEEFPQKWIGRGSQVPWPARSPDCNPLDFFLWGYIKEKVYSRPIQNVENLIFSIGQAAATITEEMLINVQNSITKRTRACIDQRGSHFEQIKNLY